MRVVCSTHYCRQLLICSQCTASTLMTIVSNYYNYNNNNSVCLQDEVLQTLTNTIFFKDELKVSARTIFIYNHCRYKQSKK